MPKPYPKEFRDDVVRVALNREPGVRIKDIAADFATSESCLQNWLTQADRDEGVRSGTGPRGAQHFGLPDRRSKGPQVRLLRIDLRSIGVVPIIMIALTTPPTN